jgi:hypothetical protein
VLCESVGVRFPRATYPRPSDGVTAESFIARCVRPSTMSMWLRRKTSSTEGPIWRSAATHPINGCVRSSRPGSAKRHRVPLGKALRLRLPSQDSSWDGNVVNGERNSMRRFSYILKRFCSRAA